ncbi:PTS lactose/cellobiose transporter subunit IIA [Bacillus sp. HU-1818]|uniref:PTS lichenan transporter subunit IIA n=1 Tax=Bacillus sp. HU-1818 TaxID=2704469 RepID=UPI001F5D99E3|nr:PTS lichenan transporter subunit IIA [Bacillus sp. HU-1818]MCI3195324.1 PTS lactose/cellobiose transporter subunit IIA [Bacillus sp. HU-1818]
MNENMEQIIFQIILHGGNGRSSAMEAIAAAKNGDRAEALKKLHESADELQKAHHFQTELIQNEAGGKKTEMSLLMVHAQDHLMNAMTVKDLAAEMIDLYEKITVQRGASI